MAWSESIDPKSGKTYYSNSETGVSVWERPREMGGSDRRDRSPPRGRDERRDRDRDDRDRRRDEGRGDGVQEDRDRSGGGKGKGGKGPNADDWECSQCQNVNRARRDACNKCNTPRARVAGGASAGAASGGRKRDSTAQRANDDNDPHRPGVPQAQNSIDWPCPQCGNINWGKRNSCNICQTNKPGVPEERREGAGGGFSEVSQEDRQRQDYQKQKAKVEAAQRKEARQRCKMCKRFACVC